MFMDDKHLQFQGFHPSEFTRSLLQEKIAALQEEAPYGATIRAVFSRKNKAFKGIVTIYSSAGKFFAIASDSKLKRVTHRLNNQLRRQLEKWKSQRFSSC